MKLRYIYMTAIAGLSLSLASCEDFLEKETDNRIELVNSKQIVQLLTTGYFTGNYGPICETSSDNVMDNNSPHVDALGDSKKTVYYNLTSYNRMYDELFAFEPVRSSTSSDSPSAVWEGCYNAIATANHALEAIDKLRNEGKVDAALNGAEGEALLIRAYNHFLLVNIFSQAYRNPTLSKNDIGIPYVTKPETEVLVHYDRGNVADVYAKIREDLEKGLKLVTDDIYADGQARKFHFNEKAAHAFAARFYLYIREYDNVIKHANIVLGETEESALACLPDWEPFAKCTSGSDFANAWLNPESPNNLLLVSTYSTAWRGMASSVRYACNGDIAKATLYSFSPTCSLAPAPWLSNSGLFINGKQDWGLLSGKGVEMFEYTDKVAGIGYPHIVRREFTSAETLLCRAEAKILKKNPDFEGAVADLRAYDKNHQILPTPGVEKYFNRDGELSSELIKKYYTKEKNPLVVLDYNTSLMDPEFIISEEAKPYFDCMMDFRRIETIGDGTRFFDVKRLGLEYSHTIGKSATVETLTWNDPRRAIEIPQEVQAAGVESSYAKVPAATAPAASKVSKSEVKSN